MKMRGEDWIEVFMKSLKVLDNESCWEKGDAEWTTCMGKVLERVGEKIGCYVTMKRNITKEDDFSGEYLGVDSMFIDNEAFNDLKPEDWKVWDPPVLPSAVVELENSYDHKLSMICGKSFVFVLQ